MASIRITRFGGLLPQMGIRLLPNDRAQIAHNCLLWDGLLRPMPQWQVDKVAPSLPLSLYKYTVDPSGYNYDVNLRCAILNLNEPFSTNQPIGIQTSAGALATYTGSFSTRCLLGAPQPTIIAQTQTVTSNNRSIYPISRTYAVTFANGTNEGPPTILPQLGLNGSLFEGDNVQIQLTLDPLQLSQYNVTNVRFYRTIPGFDTAEQLGNPLETGFHYIGAVFSPGTNVTFLDTADSTNIDGSLLISDEWMPPPNAPQRASLFFGQTESGWAVNARLSGSIGQPPNIVEFSERFMHHAWPPQNKVLLPEYITGMAVFYDNVFVGTTSTPYVIQIANTDAEALSINPKPFTGNNFACVQNTMVATNFGAIYAAKDGLIALTADGERVSTKQIASPGDALNTGTTSFHFYDISQAGWWNSNYFGFANGAAYIFNQPNPANNEFPLGELVTIDVPSGPVGPSIATGTGFYASFGNGIYKFALPAYGYESAPKAQYTWKSKRYVMPGLTTWAAAKVVNDNSGTLFVTINCYNDGNESSPSFTYTRPVIHSRPFRLPHQFKCMEFEFILSGTSVVNEFHIATDIRELTEQPNG